MTLKFWKTTSGRSPVEEFIDKLRDAHAQQAIYDKLDFIESSEQKELMASGTLDPVGGYKPLLETRIRRGKAQYRLLSVVKDTVCWVLHVFSKKSRKILPQDLDTAMKRAKSAANIKEINTYGAN